MITLLFVIFLIILIAIGILAKKYGSSNFDDYILANRSLNKYFIGLSAAATGNSGFIMTGAVGLGFVFGVTWIFLPIAWLIGDLVYWSYFPGKLNRYSKETSSRTLSEILSHTANDGRKKSTVIISSLILFIILCAYTGSQYIAAAKTFTVFFELDSFYGIILTGIIISSYIVFGGLRASVWTDMIQIIVIATVTIMVLILSINAVGGLANLVVLLNDIDPNLLVPFNNMSFSLIIGFFIGWSSAALGFGLSQPQVMIRFFAGKSPEETQKARLTYIGFLQFTWIGMTIFGVVARAILVEVEDPEAALFLFVSKNFSSLYVSIILIGVFSAIVSTIDSLILACSNIFSVDLLPIITKKELSNKKYIHQFSTLAIILFTLVLALFVQSSVFTLSAFAVSFLAATIGVAILLKITRPDISFKSINVVLLTSGITAIVWRLLGYHNDVNEAFPSLLIGLFIGWFVDKYIFNDVKKPHNKQINRTP